MRDPKYRNKKTSVTETSIKKCRIIRRGIFYVIIERQDPDYSAASPTGWKVMTSAPSSASKSASVLLFAVDSS